MLLDEPDPTVPLVSELSQQLREELNRLDTEYKKLHAEGMERLHADANWQQLEPEQRNGLLSAQKLSAGYQPKVEVQTTPQVLGTLHRLPLGQFADQIAALPGRSNAVLEQAAELCEPEAQFVSLPRRTLKTAQEIDAWVLEAKSQLNAALEKGPVVIK